MLIKIPMLSLSDQSLAPDLGSVLSARGYELEAGDFQVRRPDREALPVRTPAGVRAVAKHYPHGGGEAAFANAVAVWNSSFGRGRRPTVVPEPLHYEADLSLAVYARLPGTPMETHPLADSAIAQWERVVDLLAELHRSDAQPTTRRSARGVLRSLDRRLDWIKTHSPEHQSSFEQVLVAMESRRRKGSGLVPSHGDFSIRNILVHEETLVVIDWDRFQWADPARDLAYVATSSWLASVRRGRQPNHALIKRLVRRYESVNPASKVAATMSFYIAAALLRRAASLLQLWPAERYLATPLINLALAEVV